MITFGISSILIDTGNESPSHMTIAVDNSEMLTYMRRNQNKSENIRMNQMALIEMKSSEIKRNQTETTLIKLNQLESIRIIINLSQLESY